MSEPSYTLAFGVTTLLATGGYMLMPFGSAYTVHNLGIDIAHLADDLSGIGTVRIFTGPSSAAPATRSASFRPSCSALAMSIVMVLIYTHLGEVT